MLNTGNQNECGLTSFKINGKKERKKEKDYSLKKNILGCIMNGIQLIQEHMFKFKHQLQSVLGACYVLC